jgi:hypothetical protein
MAIEMPGVQHSYSQITTISSFGHFLPVACSQPPLKYVNTCVVCSWIILRETWDILAATAAAVFVLLQLLSCYNCCPAIAVAGRGMSYPQVIHQGRHLNNCSCHIQLDKRGQHYQEPQVTTQLQ